MENTKSNQRSWSTTRTCGPQPSTRNQVNPTAYTKSTQHPTPAPMNPSVTTQAAPPPWIAAMRRIKEAARRKPSEDAKTSQDWVRIRGCHHHRSPPAGSKLTNMINTPPLTCMTINRIYVYFLFKNSFSFYLPNPFFTNHIRCLHFPPPPPYIFLYNCYIIL